MAVNLIDSLRFAVVRDELNIPLIRVQDVPGAIHNLRKESDQLLWNYYNNQGSLETGRLALPVGGGSSPSAPVNDGITEVGEVTISWSAPNNNNNWRTTGLTLPDDADWLIIEFMGGRSELIKKSDIEALTVITSLASGGGAPALGTFIHLDDVHGNFGFYLGRDSTNQLLVGRDSSAFTKEEEIHLWKIARIVSSSNGISSVGEVTLNWVGSDRAYKNTALTIPDGVGWFIIQSIGGRSEFINRSDFDSLTAVTDLTSVEDDGEYIEFANAKDGNDYIIARNNAGEVLVGRDNNPGHTTTAQKFKLWSVGAIASAGGGSSYTDSQAISAVAFALDNSEDVSESDLNWDTSSTRIIGSIKPNIIETSHLKDQIVTEAKLAPNGIITSNMLKAGIVTRAKLAQDVIDLINSGSGGSGGSSTTTQALTSLSAVPPIANYNVNDIVNVMGELYELVDDTDESNVLRGKVNDLTGNFIGDDQLSWEETPANIRLNLNKESFDLTGQTPPATLWAEVITSGGSDRRNLYSEIGLARCKWC